MATVAHGRLGSIHTESDICAHTGRTLAIALDEAAQCAGVPMTVLERTNMVSNLKGGNAAPFKGIGFAAK